MTQNGSMSRDRGMTGAQILQEEADDDARELLKKVGSWERLTRENGGSNYYVTRQRVRAIQAEDALLALRNRLNEHPDSVVATYEEERQSLIKAIEELTEAGSQKDNRIKELEELLALADQDQASVSGYKKRIKDLEAENRELKDHAVELSAEVVQRGNEIEQYEESDRQYTAAEVVDLMLQMSRRNAELERRILKLVMRHSS